MLARWLDGLRHFLVDRENKFSSPHKKKGIQKSIELGGTLRCQLSYPLPTARSALPKPFLTALAVLSWRSTASLVGNKAPLRSLNWWLQWLCTVKSQQVPQLRSVTGFQLFWLVCLLFWHSCAHLWDTVDCLGLGFLKEQDPWHCRMYISVTLAKNIWTHWTIFRRLYQQGVSKLLGACNVSWKPWEEKYCFRNTLNKRLSHELNPSKTPENPHSDGPLYQCPSGELLQLQYAVEAPKSARQEM